MYFICEESFSFVENARLRKNVILHTGMSQSQGYIKRQSQL